MEHSPEGKNGIVYGTVHSPPPERSSMQDGTTDHEEKLSRLHDIFRYRSSTISTVAPQERIPSTTRTSLG